MAHREQQAQRDEQPQRKPHNEPLPPPVAAAASSAAAHRHAHMQNDLTFLRIRTKKHEIMIAPEKEFTLVVVQNPNSD